VKLKSILPLLAAGLVTVLAVAGLAGAAGTPPKNTSLPTVTGSAEQGKTLTGHVGSWTGDKPITYKWQWKRCNAFGNKCANITGGTSQAYVLKAEDVGTKLRINVTATNGAGFAVAESNPTALVQPRGVTTTTTPAPVPPANGCPSGSGPVDVSQVSLPARLVIDGQSLSPSPITRSTSDITMRFHVSACNGRSVAGALVYATAVPFNQFSIAPETATGADGWATLTEHRGAGFPASPRQQLLAVFVRARKSGESLIGGVSTRLLVSFPVRLNG
jgi:hypothetical protein